MKIELTEEELSDISVALSLEHGRQIGLGNHQRAARVSQLKHKIDQAAIAARDPSSAKSD